MQSIRSWFRSATFLLLFLLTLSLTFSGFGLRGRVRLVIESSKLSALKRRPV